ncbi:hypothetical protein [Arthrobacter sp. NPDC092385]|uniref:hypothetical protein n=1 Tax=Arthrobacter sp. NPDC092385 TaxID=3363943 RepID=UPI003809A891
MNDSVEPAHGGSADEELSTSLAGHTRLPDRSGDSSAATADDSSTDGPVNDEASPVLEEIDDSPVRTDNS